MKNKNKKKSLLSLAVSLAPVGATFFGQGRYVEGAVVTAVTVGLILGYDHLDDKEKQSVRLPEGVDKETITDIAETVGEKADDVDLSKTLDDVAPNDDSN